MRKLSSLRSILLLLSILAGSFSMGLAEEQLDYLWPSEIGVGVLSVPWFMGYGVAGPVDTICFAFLDGQWWLWERLGLEGSIGVLFNDDNAYPPPALALMGRSFLRTLRIADTNLDIGGGVLFVPFPRVIGCPAMAGTTCPYFSGPRFASLYFLSVEFKLGTIIFSAEIGLFDPYQLESTFIFIEGSLRFQSFKRDD